MAKKASITAKVKQEVINYADRLRRHGIDFQQLIVFGSQVKGKQHFWSDIDVCVVGRGFGKNRFEERLDLMELTDKQTANIEPHPYHPKDLKNKWDPLAAEILKYGVRFNR